jgi:hypothetical protein
MKRNNFKILALLLVFALSLSSCGGDDSGDSFGTTTGDYWPMAVNNIWNFDNDGGTAELKLTGSTVFGSTTYYELYDESTDPSLAVQNWVAKKGATYVQKMADATIVQDGVTIEFEGYEVPLFKDNVEQNGSWTGSISPSITYTSGGISVSPPTHIVYTGTILEKNVSVSLNGVTYPDVIKMKMVMDITIGDQTSSALQEYWFAKDVGPIRQYQNSSEGTFDLTLLNYTLN